MPGWKVWLAIFRAGPGGTRRGRPSEEVLWMRRVSFRVAERLEGVG